MAGTVYFAWCAYDPTQWHFIDNVNLLIHESGHIVFWPFGEFLYVLVGSLTQVLLPALFVLSFYRQGQYFSSALTLFWVGENFLSVSVYAGDALTMQLPLITGDNSGHDWNWLLTRTDLLLHTAGIALTIRTVGTIVIVMAAVWSVYIATHDTSEA